MVSFIFNQEPKKSNSLSQEKTIDFTGNKKLITIPVHKVILTCRIQETILALQPNFDFQKYIIVEDNTLPLSRIDTMLDDQLYNTKERPPVDIELYYNDLYRIVNGRHRIVRALLLGHETISAHI